MPGMPVQSSAPIPAIAGANADATKYTKVLVSPEVTFAVYVAPTPPPDNNPFAFRPVNNVNYQAINDAKNRLQQEYTFPTTLVIQTERDTTQNGQPCHEMVYRATLGYDDIGTAPTKTLVARVYVANDKTYTLIVLGARVKSDAPDVVKFFQSFRIQAAANPNPAPPVGRQPPASPGDLNGLLAYWSFDNVQGDQALDESGNALTGTLHQATVINDGARGQALHCNGPGSYFDFSDANNLNFGAADDFTFCGWVRTHAPQGMVLSCRQGQSAAAEILVKVDKGALAVEVRQDGNDRSIPAAFRGPAVNDGAWHHFALIRHHRDGFGASVELFVDGVRRGGQLNFNTAGPVTTDLRASAPSCICSATASWAQPPPSPATWTSSPSSTACWTRARSAGWPASPGPEASREHPRPESGFRDRTILRSLTLPARPGFR